MLARKSKYRKILRKFSRLFGHTNKITSQSRFHVSGWRFVFASFIVFSIFAYFFPFGRLLNSIMAFGGHTETISLYANSIVTNDAEEFTEGWHNKEKATGAQDLGPDADMLDFSDENSAFYSGGNYSLIASDFRFLTEDTSKLIEKEQAENISTDEADNVNVEDDSVLSPEMDTKNEIEEGVSDAVDASPVPVVDDFEIPLENNSSDAVNGEDAESFDSNENQISEVDEDVSAETEDSNSENIGSEEQDTFIENINDNLEDIKVEEVPSTETEAEVIGTEESLSEGIISLTKKVKSFFAGTIANAQSLVSPEIKSLSDLGTFKSAVINLSLAIHTGLDNVESALNSENEANPEVLDADGASSADETIADLDKKTDDSPIITIWYSLGAGEEVEASSSASTTDNLLWQKLDEISSDSISNALNGGYFSFVAPFLESWQDVENLKIKLEAIDNGQKNLIYLDSIWVDSVFERETELDKLKQRQRWEEALKFLSDDLVFKAGESGVLKFQYKKNEERIWETLGEFFGIGNFWKNVNLSIKLIDPSGTETDVALTTIFESDGTFTVRLPETSEIMPGLYRLQFSIIDSSGDVTEEFVRTQEFYWGVLAMNFNKSIYEEDDNGFVQMAVLDDNGRTICNAEVNLEVKDADGNILQFSTSETDETKRIYISDECGPDTVTNVPDYSLHYQFGGLGKYEFKLTAKTSAGEKSISEIIEVKNDQVFSVERFGPTRIWPKADYVMKMEVVSSEDFTGDVVETVPMGFKISNFQFLISKQLQNFQFLIEDVDDKKQLVIKDVVLKAGESLEIDYTFDAPDRSPELYLAGPLQTEIENRKSVIESRSWQIASDTFLKRARTVMFQAGTWSDTSAGGNTGQNTNTDYTFSAFNWRLGESGVAIKNAYVIMDTQFEAYNTTGVAYSGYKLGFDACVETCTSAAFGVGSGQVLIDNGNTLVYDDTESNAARLLLDVTNETQLAEYTGNGVLMQSQFGYRLKNVTTHVSIANVSAMLVVTYTYDVDSPNITNTVIYPLDSTNGTDNGTRQASAGTCTADNGSCPNFDYNMDIPEWPGVATSTNRVSQWFKLNSAPDLTGTTDVRPYLDINSANVDSGIFHFESALNNNGGMPIMYFPNWTNSGYAENQNQQIEYFTGSTVAANYMLGGEVGETYIASSSASTKTRTVSFPMGVISNGNSVALSSKSVNVYFPENGSATGTVDIKSAWVRIGVHGAITSSNYSVTISSKTGNNSTSADQTYTYNANGVMFNPETYIFYIIPASDYTELEGARATSSKQVTINLTYSNANFSGASAELMITYAYTSETNGYLSNLKLFGGQSSVSPATSTFLATANSVLPEATSTTMFAAGLYASFLTSNSSGLMDATVHLSRVNLSTGTPNCGSPTYRALPDSVNMYSEMYQDVTSILTTKNNQTYNACYANDNTALTTDGAKMNGQLIYTYGWTNSPPTGSFITASTTAKKDGTGIIDVGVEIYDKDLQDVRAKIEFATGTTCNFITPGKAILDETDASTFADYGDPYVLNSSTYQVGTANGYIKTASGSNSVFFDWQAKNNLGAVNGTYCLRLSANDMYLDQTILATTTVYVDTLVPTKPGPLSLNSRKGTSVTLNLGATTTETNFSQYKIFYKLANGTDPTESDTVWASTSDINLYNKLFNGKSTTTINVGLVASTTYSFAIWVYDNYGNKASSSRIDVTTNDAPLGSFNKADTKQKNNASGIVDISIELDDANDQNLLKARIDVATGTACNFSTFIDPDLDENQANISADFGVPTIENDNVYQVGGPGAWIMTSPGSNTVNFDWFSKTNLPNGDNTYCLRLIANDSFDDQLQIATTTITIDNVKPTATGPLSAGTTLVNSIVLAYNTGLLGADTNEPTTNAYKIYYKQGTTGVTEGLSGEIEIDNTNLDAYNFKGATSTIVNGLLENTWYVFKIWTYDAFGNKASSSEVAIKTNAAINNQSFIFSNALSEGMNTNIAAVIPGGEWNFRAVVTNLNGWLAISSTTLRLANNNDITAPYSDLVFRWNQTGEMFSEIGNDANNVAILSPNSTSTCEDITCTINFKIVFNKLFTDTNMSYDATLTSDSDSGVTVENNYPNFYQVRFPYIEQTHYRWRNDDGGE